MANRGRYKYDDLVINKDAKIDGDFIKTTNHMTYIIRRLKNELTDMAHVAPNPDEHTNRYYQEKTISPANVTAYNDVEDRRLKTSDNDKKITVDKINSLVQYYNSLKSNGFLPNDVFKKVPELQYGDKLSNELFFTLRDNLRAIGKYLDQTWNQSFNADGYCIKSCQDGCQINCEISAQLPGDEGGYEYPQGIGIQGFDHAYPGRYYSSEPPKGASYWKIMLVNSGTNAEERERRRQWEAGTRVAWFTPRDQLAGYRHNFGVVNNTLKERIRKYNKEREDYNRAQKASGKKPYGYKPYYSWELNTFVAPISDEWLDSSKANNFSRNGAHNYYHDLPKYAEANRNNFVFVDLDNDWVVRGTNDVKYNKRSVDYYRYIKYGEKNNPPKRKYVYSGEMGEHRDD